MSLAGAPPHAESPLLGGGGGGGQKFRTPNQSHQTLDPQEHFLITVSHRPLPFFPAHNPVTPLPWCL